MKKNCFIFVFLILLVTSLQSCDKKKPIDENIATADFFVQAEKTNFMFSPDGKRLSYIGFDDHCRNIFILDLVNPDSSKQLTYQSDMNVQYYFWADNESIVFSNTQSYRDSLRLMIIDVQTESQKYLIPPSREKLRWINKDSNKDELVAAISTKDSSIFDLYSIDMTTGEKELILQNPGNIARWYASSDGEVRLALTNDSLEESLLYRASTEQPFVEVKKNDFITSVFPIGFVRNSIDHIYALSNEGRDKIALVEIDLSTGEEVREIFSHPKVDINFDGYSTTTNEMLFASYTVDKNEQVFFDEKLESIVSKLKKQFEEKIIRILDVDLDTEQIIFKVYSDVDPGGVYYYNKVNDDLKLLVEEHPGLKGKRLNRMEPVQFTTRDNKQINGYLTFPGNKRKDCPLVVLVHDGPARRDVWGFNPEVQFLASRGFAVFQINYRGSSGFGKEFWTAGFKQWGGKIQTDIIDGVTWLIHEGVVDKDRVAIMGNGFGGYSALHAATFSTSMFKCAISTSGFSNLFTFFREIPPHLQQYLQLYYEVIGNPHLEPDLFRAISPVFHADKVKIPVLFVQGGKDNYSSITDANQFVQTLKKNNIPVKYIYKEEEGRRFKNEENKISYYLEVVHFLDEYLK